MITTTLLLVLLALVFDFINGFHDTANAVATSVSTRALSPKQAVILSSALNFCGAVAFSGVAETIGTEIITPSHSNTLPVIAAALLSAVTWNLITWWFGLPSSSSHALISALCGSAAACGHNLNPTGMLHTLKALCFSPPAAFLMGISLMSALRLSAPRDNHRSRNRFLRFQIFGAAFQSFCHGSNDGQKTMGVITMILMASGYMKTFEVPCWVKLLAASAIALGTLVGGWRIINTVGNHITAIEPRSGFAADLSSGLMVMSATLFKLPVSTTHVVSSAILGVGVAGGSEVKWNTAKKIAAAWLLTIPAAFTLSYLLFTVTTVLISR